MEILVQADRFLHAVLVDLLIEISVSIEQADGDEIEVEVAGGFAMIAGENAETAGVIRDRFVKAELGGEIGDRFLERAAGAGFSVGILAREIFAEGIVNLLQFAEKIFVLRDFDQPRLAGKLEHADGVVIGPIPQLGIEMAEETARGRLPRPPQIEDDLAQRLERGREHRDDVVGLEGRHAALGVGNGAGILSGIFLAASVPSRGSLAFLRRPGDRHFIKLQLPAQLPLEEEQIETRLQNLRRHRNVPHLPDLKSGRRESSAAGSAKSNKRDAVLNSGGTVFPIPWKTLELLKTIPDARKLSDAMVRNSAP